MRSRIVFISVFLIAFLIAKSQSVNFQYSPNKLIIKKEIDLDKKDFQINGDTKVCKGKATEFMISTGDVARWSNGVIDIKASYTITSDTVIKAIVTNKYGCEFERTKFVKRRCFLTCLFH
ncbi:MAG: hypothetical protein IPN10_09485 [Saprospiraceae bacterium]|nr:hypothetical protein [Saprospiraceae bacterium]